MAYDLFLKPAPGAADPPDAGLLRAWLAARPHYRAGESVEGRARAVHYADPDTGVTFALDLAPAPVDGKPGGTDGDPTLAAVGVDLLAPGFFADVAAVELAALCGEFGLICDDPQAGASGPFAPAAFRETWGKTAELAARHAAARGRPPLTAPAASLNAAHAWNAARARWRDRTPEGGPGVPRVQLRTATTDCGEQTVRTWCAWVDAAPLVLPPVDDVLLVRDALRPRKLLFFRGGGASLALVPRESVAAAPGFGPAPERFPPGSRQLLHGDAATRAWFRSPPADPAPPDAVPPGRWSRPNGWRRASGRGSDRRPRAERPGRSRGHRPPGCGPTPAARSGFGAPAGGGRALFLDPLRGRRRSR